MIEVLFSRAQLVLNLTKEFIFLIVMLAIFYVAMTFFGHEEHSRYWAGTLVIISITKIYFLVSHTFKKLDSMIENNHSFNHLLLLLGAIISIIVISFAMDYLCALEIYPNAFSGIQNDSSLIFRFVNLLYFSIVTFTTVGYGDIAPVISVAKLLTVFEMITAFIVIVFIISKYFKSN